MGFECHATEPMKLVKNIVKNNETIEIKRESSNSKNVANFRRKNFRKIKRLHLLLMFKIKMTNNLQL